jgi:hypothetical protein
MTNVALAGQLLGTSESMEAEEDRELEVKVADDCDHDELCKL